MISEDDVIGSLVGHLSRSNASSDEKDVIRARLDRLDVQGIVHSLCKGSASSPEEQDSTRTRLSSLTVA